MSVELQRLVDEFFEAPGADAGRKKDIEAQLALFKQRPDALSVCRQLLSEPRGASAYTQWFCLSVFEPSTDRQAVKAFLWSLLSSTDHQSSYASFVQTKLATLVVQIARQELPSGWPTYFDDILAVQTSNPLLCLTLVRLTVEEFTAPRDKSSQALPIVHRGRISSPSTALCKAALDVFHHLFAWIPLDSPALTQRFVATLLRFAQLSDDSVCDLGAQSLACLNEIMSRKYSPSGHSEFVALLMMHISELLRYLTQTQDPHAGCLLVESLNEEYARSVINVLGLYAHWLSLFRQAAQSNAEALQSFDIHQDALAYDSDTKDALYRFATALFVLPPLNSKTSDELSRQNPEMLSETIHLFMAMLKGDALVAHLQRDSGSAVVERSIGFLSAAIDHPVKGNSQLLPGIIAFCEKAFDGIRPLFFGMLYRLMLNHWRYFFNTRIGAQSGGSASEAKNEAEFAALIQMFVLPFRGPHVEIIKQNMSSLIQLDDKCRLFHKTYFVETLAAPIVELVVDMLLQRTHDFLREDMIDFVSRIATADVQLVPSKIMPMFLSKRCSQFGKEQQEALASRWLAIKDVETAKESIQTLMREYSVYESVMRAS
nr:Exportin-6 [Polyrhizophydium stewartii]